MTQELKLWQNLINNGNEKGRRHQVFLHLKLEPLSKAENDVNQMRQCLYEANPTIKNILGVIREEIELETLSEDEDKQLSLDNRDFSDGEPQKKRLKNKRCTQQKTKKQRRVDSKEKNCWIGIKSSY
ncbi:hypothetical protein CQW23_15127 [Capsicum baccatum]|uniref:Uncharacterized protein n=1 Tax=Capsicum baccatum TaxID=33114 RepID=A0A2G2WLC1_CAPBA|nr:hypothetical protein CQW23_15127 [Capsicum baccatum]